MEQDTEKLVGHVELSSLISSTEFQALESQFNRFCPFEAVGMVRAEIRHSNFLGYVLNPFRPHGFGIALLRAFLVSALGDSFSAEIGTEAMREAEIRREWRNIDLLVLLPRAKCVVVVELKIDAPQSADQLTRYRKIEPLRVCRRLFGLSYAAITDASSMA